MANVVDGNLLAADADGVSGKTINIAAGQSITLLEMLAALGEFLGTRAQPEFAPARLGDIRESQADISEARRLLGYEPRTDFREGLKLSIEYYRNVAAGRA